MSRLMMLMAALCAAAAWLLGTPPCAGAQQIPAREYIGATNAAPYVAVVGPLQNGTLEAVRVWRCAPTNAVLTVSQVYRVGALTVTSTLGTVSGDLSGNGARAFTNAWVFPGDRLVYQFGSATTGTVETVRRVPAD